MTWDEWCKTYPTPEVEVPPVVPDDSIFTDRRDAERYLDYRELWDEVAYRVVKHGDRFFVVLAD
jgi:hypothetical protein